MAELEQQVAALRFAAEQGNLVREQFADLYDYAPVGYLTVDAAGVIHRVNVPAAALLGGSRQDLANRKLVTLVRPADKARFTAFVKEVFTATGPVSVEVALVRGKWRAEHLQIVAAPAAAGRDLGHAGAQARLAVLDITDRWKAEEALRESRDRFQAVIASMAEGVVVHDATGAIRECNTAAQRILGLSEDELLGLRSIDPRWSAIHEDGSPFPGDQHPAMEVIRTGASRWNVPMGVHRPDGDLVWLRVNADPLRNPDGTVRGAVATFTDVTEERRRAAEQAEVLARLSFVIDGSDDGFWDWHVDTGTTKYSRRLARMLGFDLDDLQPNLAALDERAHPDDRERAWAELRRHLDGEVDQHVAEVRLKHRDGHWVRTLVRGRVVARDGEGKPVRVAGTLTDLSQRAELEQALAASEKRYQDLVAGMRDGLVVQQDGEIVFANPAASRLAGFADPTAMCGSVTRLPVDDASRREVMAATARVLAGETVAPIDVTLVTPDGTARIVESMPSLVSFDGRPAIQVVQRDVTETRRLEAELARATKELRRHVENTPLASIEWDGAYRVTRFSPRAEAIFGWREEEILGRRIDEVPWLPEEDWPLVRSVMADMESGARPVNVSANRNRCKDGRIIHCEWFNSCLYDAGGKLGSVFSLVQDVTARVEAEAEVAKARARLAEVLDASTDGHFEADLTLGQVAVNDRWNEIAGRPRGTGTIPMADWEALVHPGDRAAAGPAMQAAREGRADVLDLTYRIRHSDGSWRWVRTRARVVGRDARGTAIRLVGATSDVHERVVAEEEVRRSRDLLSLLIEHAPASIALFDREMRYLAASRRWANTHGLAGKEYVGRVIYDVHPGIPESWREAHRRGLAGEPLSTELDTAVPGRERDEVVRWEIQPWRTVDGAVGGIAIFSEIVTEQRALQARLLAASKLEALGTLVGGMAHEINNPLAAEMAQSGFAAEIVREARDRIAAQVPSAGPEVVASLDEALDALREAQESSVRIAAIVRDLVKFGRQDQGKDVLRLRAVVDDALRWLASACSARAEVRLEDAGAPDVEGVESQILQAVVALLTNACQAAPPGRRGTITVRIGAGAPGLARIEVEDDGVGMTPEVLSRVFDPFYTTRDVGQGKGLGLSVAHAIATAHGGTLTAESRPGSGSVFRLELPAARRAPTGR